MKLVHLVGFVIKKLFKHYFLYRSAAFLNVFQVGTTFMLYGPPYSWDYHTH